MGSKMHVCIGYFLLLKFNKSIQVSWNKISIGRILEFLESKDKLSNPAVQGHEAAVVDTLPSAVLLAIPVCWVNS